MIPVLHYLCYRIYQTIYSRSHAVGHVGIEHNE